MESGTLKKLIAANPEGQSVFQRTIEAQPSEETVILPRRFQRHRVGLRHRVILYFPSGNAAIAAHAWDTFTAFSNSALTATE